MKEETPDEIKQQRDALLKIEGAAQKREDETQRVLTLLIYLGDIDANRIEQAREMVRKP